MIFNIKKLFSFKRENSDNIKIGVQNNFNNNPNKEHYLVNVQGKIKGLKMINNENYTNAQMLNLEKGGEGIELINNKNYELKYQHSFPI